MTKHRSREPGDRLSSRPKQSTPRVRSMFYVILLSRMLLRMLFPDHIPILPRSPKSHHQCQVYASTYSLATQLCSLGAPISLERRRNKERFGIKVSRNLQKRNPKIFYSSLLAAAAGHMWHVYTLERNQRTSR